MRAPGRSIFKPKQIHILHSVYGNNRFIARNYRFSGNLLAVHCPKTCVACFSRNSGEFAYRFTRNNTSSFYRVGKLVRESNGVLLQSARRAVFNSVVNVFGKINRFPVVSNKGEPCLEGKREVITRKSLCNLDDNTAAVGRFYVYRVRCGVGKPAFARVAVSIAVCVIRN